MADEALFVGWGPVARGRERVALEIFQETLEFWGQAQRDGRIEGFEPFLLQPHGGGLGGFMLIRGQRTRLDELSASPEFTRVLARAGMVVEELGVVRAYGGEALGRQMAAFQEASSELAAA